MQDTHTIEGGRLYAAGSGGGDRRLRPHINQSNQQALKCPRCDSLNTKFCYYNNYNLSQPRHFCKSCRRYWTKGGVLRNVPVGGGCRKTKSSRTKQASSAAASSSSVAGPRSERNSSSHSSSESSSLTATTTAAKINTPTTACSTGEVASATVSSSNAQGNLVNFADSRFFLAQVGGNGSSFDQSQSLIDPIATSEGQIFTEMGSFTSLMTSSNDPGMLSFASSMADISGYGLPQTGHGSVLDDQGLNPLVGGGQMKMEPINNCGGFFDQTSQIGFPGLAQNRISNGGLLGLDWQMDGGGGGVGGGDGGGGGDQPLFDFAGPVDQAYWGGQNQWSDHDQYLNFPPLV